MAEKATGANQMPNSDQGNNEPESLTESQLHQINTLVNSAFTARFRPIQEKLDTQFGELKSLLLPKEEEKPLPKKVQELPEVIAIQNKLKALENERLKTREKGLRLTVQDQLIKAGVNPSAVKAVVAMHVDADRAISYAGDDSDEIVFRTNDSTYTLSDGISQWLRTEEAKSFLPPRNVKGTGNRNYQTQATTSKPVRSMEAAGNALASFILGKDS